MIRMILLLSLTIVSCSRFQSKPTTLGDFSRLTVPGDANLNPSTDRIDTQCLENQNYDTCLFKKNPVAQILSPISPPQVAGAQTFGVKMTGLRPATNLQNSHISIRTIRTLILNPFETLKRPWAPEDSYAEQLSAYYWSMRFIDYQSPRLGGLAVEGRNIKIIVDDAVTGWSYVKNAISLKRTTIPHALQGEIVISLLAQAEVDHLTSGALKLGTNDTLHKICANDPHGCCVSSIGCSKALRSAAGDYFAATLFPNQPRIGETLQQSVQGQSRASLTRDLNLLAQRSLLEVFTTTQGDVYMMGAFYASTFWQIREEAKAQWSDGDVLVDQFFHACMKQWTAQDTFQTAKAKAELLAGSFASGRLSTLVQDVFVERGF